MTQALRTAAQALLDAVDGYGSMREQDIRDAKETLRADLATPAPADDERVVEHMRLVLAYATASAALAGKCSDRSGHRVAIPDDFCQRVRETLATVESSASALLAASREDAEMLDWLAGHATEVAISPKNDFDTRLKWALPTLVSWADYCGHIGFREAVTIAMEAKKS